MLTKQHKRNQDLMQYLIDTAPDCNPNYRSALQLALDDNEKDFWIHKRGPRYIHSEQDAKLLWNPSKEIKNTTESEESETLRKEKIHETEFPDDPRH